MGVDIKWSVGPAERVYRATSALWRFHSRYRLFDRLRSRLTNGFHLRAYLERGIHLCISVDYIDSDGVEILMPTTFGDEIAEAQQRVPGRAGHAADKGRVRCIDRVG